MLFDNQQPIPALDSFSLLILILISSLSRLTHPVSHLSGLLYEVPYCTLCFVLGELHTAWCVGGIKTRTQETIKHPFLKITRLLMGAPGKTVNTREGTEPVATLGGL